MEDLEERSRLRARLKAVAKLDKDVASLLPLVRHYASLHLNIFPHANPRSSSAELSTFQLPRSAKS